VQFAAFESSLKSTVTVDGKPLIQSRSGFAG
jgi:hypothetical protein